MPLRNHFVLLVSLSVVPACAQSALDFVSQLYPVFEKAQCRLCHNDNGVASRTRLQFPSEEAGAAEIAAFSLRLAALVDRNNPDESLLLRKTTNRVPHTGGERIHNGSGEEEETRHGTD